MAELQLGNIKPAGADNVVVDSKYVKGGYITVANISERNALVNANTKNIVEGSLCYCQDDDKFYKYNGTSWEDCFVVDSELSASSTNAVQNKVIKAALDGKAASSHGNHVPATVTHNNKKFLRSDNTWADVTPANIGAIPASEKAAANGVATLDANGLIPTSQLPSFVDDVIEGYYHISSKCFYKYSGYTDKLPSEAGKIYVDLATKKTYRWSGSDFVVISETIAIGTTQGTALDGKTGNDHITNKLNPHGVTKAQVGLGNVDNTADANKRVAYATEAGHAGSADTATEAVHASSADTATNAGHADSAGAADTATKATKDASGNVITTTYATKTYAENQVATHNTSNSAHSDIRQAVTNLSSQVESLLGVDGEKLGQMEDLLEQLENSSADIGNKLNKSDVVNNLTTTDTAKALSAAQGPVIVNLINGKADASHGNHVPATQTANNKKFLRNDNTWQEVTPANIGAAAASHGNHVPTTVAAHNNKKFLRSDNTWADVTPANIGAAASSHGTHVPAVETANNAKFLRNDNTWQTVTPANIGAVPTARTVNGKPLSSDITLGASDVGAAASSHGNHVPTTVTHNNKKFLRSDNTWADVTPANIGAAASSHGTHVPTPETANSKKFLRNDNTWQEVTPANIGAAASSHGTHVTYDSTNKPKANGTAAFGTSAAVARADHVHPLQTSVSGKAGSADKLNTDAGSATQPVYFSNGVPVATTYGLNIATASAAGLVKPISVITKPTINRASSTAGKYYPVQMSSDGNMFVNVPWQDVQTYPKFSSGLQIGQTEEYSKDDVVVSKIYVPYATKDQYGVVKTAADRASTVTATTGETTAGRYYGVEKDSTGKLFVNVPWTNVNSDYVSKSSTDIQCVAGGLVVGKSSSAGVTATGIGRIMFTGQSNPLIGVQAVDASGTAKTAYFIQSVASDDCLYIGPTSTKALKFNPDGNMYSPANLEVGGELTVDSDFTVFGSCYFEGNDLHDVAYLETSELTASSINCYALDVNNTDGIWENGAYLKNKYAAKSHKHSMAYNYNSSTGILTITATDLT